MQMSIANGTGITTDDDMDRQDSKPSITEISARFIQEETKRTKFLLNFKSRMEL